MIIKGAIKCVNYDDMIGKENIVRWRLKFKLKIFYGKFTTLFYTHTHTQINFMLNFLLKKW